MFLKRRLFQTLVFSLATVAGLSSCAKSNGTSLQSQAFNTQVASFNVLDLLIPRAIAAVPVITSMKFCVTQFKLEAPDGSAVKKDGSDLIEARLGLIDLGDGTKSVSWGGASLPPGASIKKIKVEIHKDPQTCANAQYSASINGQTITKDLEFKFTFANPKPLSSGDVVQVALTNLVGQLTSAALAANLDDTHIGAYLDGTIEDSAN